MFFENQDMIINSGGVAAAQGGNWLLSRENQRLHRVPKQAMIDEVKGHGCWFLMRVELCCTHGGGSLRVLGPFGRDPWRTLAWTTTFPLT